MRDKLRFSKCSGTVTLTIEPRFVLSGRVEFLGNQNSLMHIAVFQFRNFLSEVVTIGWTKMEERGIMLTGENNLNE